MNEVEWLTTDNPARLVDLIIAHAGLASRLTYWVQACREAHREYPPGVNALTLSTPALDSWRDVLDAVWAWASPSQKLLSPSRRADLLREVIGNPFRPVKLPVTRQRVPIGPFEVDGFTIDQGFGPEYCPLLTDEVLALAELARAVRQAGDDLDPLILRTLADELEYAGCREESLLRHLREQERHVRQCWALRLLTRREEV